MIYNMIIHCMIMLKSGLHWSNPSLLITSYHYHYIISLLLLFFILYKLLTKLMDQFILYIHSMSKHTIQY